MKEILSQNQILLYLKTMMSLGCILTSAGRFLGKYLMSPPKSPQIAFFDRPVLQFLNESLGKLLFHTLQVGIGVNFHQLLSPSFSSRHDLFAKLLTTFISLAFPYYFITCCSLSFDLIPLKWGISMFLFIENLFPFQDRIFSNGVSCSNFQIIILSILIHYNAINRQNKINYYFKFVCISYFFKLVLVFTSFNQLILNPISCLGNILLGYIASESVTPFQAQCRSMSNIRIDPYNNIYTSLYNKLFQGKFRYFKMLISIILSLIAQLIIFFHLDNTILQFFLINFMEIIAAFHASLLFLFIHHNQSNIARKFISLQSYIIKYFSASDRALMMVQQPIYGLILNKLYVVQLGPYNDIILILIYTGIVGLVFIIGYIFFLLTTQITVSISQKINTYFEENKKVAITKILCCDSEK